MNQTHRLILFDSSPCSVSHRGENSRFGRTVPTQAMVDLEASIQAKNVDRGACSSGGEGSDDKGRIFPKERCNLAHIYSSKKACFGCGSSVAVAFASFALLASRWWIGLGFALCFHLTERNVDSFPGG